MSIRQNDFRGPNGLLDSARYWPAYEASEEYRARAVRLAGGLYLGRCLTGGKTSRPVEPGWCLFLDESARHPRHPLYGGAQHIAVRDLPDGTCPARVVSHGGPDTMSIVEVQAGAEYLLGMEALAVLTVKTR